MSDGNFNRNLLPYKNYQSGLRAGKVQMKIRAISAMKAVLGEFAAELDEQQQRSIIEKFIESLGE